MHITYDISNAYPVPLLSGKARNNDTKLGRGVRIMIGGGGGGLQYTLCPYLFYYVCLEMF